MRCPNCGIVKSGFSWKNKRERAQQWLCYDCRSKVRAQMSTKEQKPLDEDHCGKRIGAEESVREMSSL